MRKVLIVAAGLLIVSVIFVAQDIPQGIRGKDRQAYVKAQRKIARGDKEHDVVKQLNGQLDSLSEAGIGGNSAQSYAIRDEVYHRVISAGSLYTSGYDKIFAILSRSYLHYKDQNPHVFDEVASAISNGDAAMKDAAALYLKARRTWSDSASLDMAMRALDIQRNAVNALMQKGMLLAFDDGDKPAIVPKELATIDKKVSQPSENKLVVVEREFDNIGHTEVVGNPVAAAAPAGNVKVEEAKPNNFNIFYTVQFKTLTSEASVENLKRWYSGKEFVEMNRHDQYYRYSVGRFYSVDDARRFISREKMNGFVVAYRGDERIAVVQARAIVGR
jgi:hypothetical protein